MILLCADIFVGITVLSATHILIADRNHFIILLPSFLVQGMKTSFTKKIMKNILVPIDFSDASFNAINYAAFIANAFNTPLTLVHAYKSVSAFDEYPETEYPDSRKQTDAKNEKFLKSEMEGIVKKFTVKIDSVVKKGNPVNVIREIAEKKHSDLIVIGMKGKGESNSRFGSTTIAMINETSVPLLIIPKEVSYQTIDTITLASDFIHETLLANFPVLEKMIQVFEPFIQIINVQRKDSKLTSEYIANKTRMDLLWNKYNHSFDIIEKDEFEEGINEYLKKNPSDLLVMIAGKRNFFTKIIHPSLTKKMTYHTKIPLLVLHEEELENE